MVAVSRKSPDVDDIPEKLNKLSNDPEVTGTLALSQKTLLSYGVS
jgi:hypothetical protein